MVPGESREGGPTRRDFARTAAMSALAIGSVLGPNRSVQGEPRKDEPDMIDTHVHVVPTGLPGIKSMPDDVLKLYEGPRSALAARVNQEMKEAQLEYVFGMGGLEAPDDDPLGISRTSELFELVPGLRAIGVADPRRTDAGHLKAVEAQIDANQGKIVAFKAYLGYLHFGPEHPNYVPYYKIAQKYKLAVIFHTGDNWSTTAKVKYAHPLRVDEVAVDHPEVRFVMAHFGNPWLTDAAEVLYKNNNVWADLSGLFVGTEAQIDKILAESKQPESASGLAISDLKKALGYVENFEKFVYGSDWPLVPMAAYRRLIAAILPPEAHRAVFRDNAMNLFRLAKT